MKQLIRITPLVALIVSMIWSFVASTLTYQPIRSAQGEATLLAEPSLASVAVDGLDLSAQATCTVTPTMLNFGTVCLGSSADQTFTVSNTGNRRLTINAITSSNGAFSVVSPALPVTVRAGQSVTITVWLTCSSPGLQSGMLSFMTSSPGGPVNCGTVAVSGTCVQPVCMVAPSSLNFGKVMAGTSVNQTLTVSNPGNIAFTINAISSTNPAFSIVSPALPVTVPSGGSVTVTVRFTCPPGTSGVRSGTISVSTSSLCGPVLCAAVPVTGECFIGPICVPNPTSIDFGLVLLNQTQQTGQLNSTVPPVCPPVPGTLVVPTFRINNAGDRCLRITAALSDNPRFSVQTMLPIEIQAGGSAEIVLQFEAREVYLTAGTITFVTECCMGDPQACNNPPDCAVSVCGTGLFGPDCIFASPVGTFPDFNFDLPFPDIVVGDMTTEGGVVQILNIGDQSLTINAGGQRPDSQNLSFTVVGFDLDGIIPPLDLPLDPNPAVPAPEICILPGDPVFMLIKFTGLDIGEQVGPIQIFSNDPANDPNKLSCILRNVRGSVVRSAQCVLIPTSLTLTAFAGCSSTQEIIIVGNAGPVTLPLSEISSTSPDVVVLDPLTNAPPVLPISIPPGGARQFIVRCTPLMTGTRRATIRFVTSDQNPSACVLDVTCVASSGPVCQVVMPETNFGQVVRVPLSDPRFGMNVGGLQFGEKRLPIEVRNIGDAPLFLTAPPGPPFTTNPFVTNTNFLVEGFTAEQIIPPNGVATGTVIFRPNLRGAQSSSIRFFTTTCVGECVIEGVSGVGITNALCQLPVSFNVGSAPLGGSVTNSFVLVNQGDLPLVIESPQQIVIDNPRFTVVTPLPIIINGSMQIMVRFSPTAVGQQLGRIEFNFNPTAIGPVRSCAINVSGTGTASGAAVASREAIDIYHPAPTSEESPSVLANEPKAQSDVFSIQLRKTENVVSQPSGCTIIPSSLMLGTSPLCPPDQKFIAVRIAVIDEITSDDPAIVVINPVTNAPPTLPFPVPSTGIALFLIRCSQDVANPRTATIRFTSNGPNPVTCALTVTCMPAPVPFCNVSMPDTVNGPPDGKSFGEIAIVPLSDPRFGQNVGGVQLGEKRLPVEMYNTGNLPIILGRDPNNNPTRHVVSVTNTNMIVEGFNRDDVIPPGEVQRGVVIFRPTLRRSQIGTMRFFTSASAREFIVTDVNGIGIDNALCETPTSLAVGTAPVGGSVTNIFFLLNRGDVPLVIDNPLQIISDDPAFQIVTPLPIMVPPEFVGGGSGVRITVRFTPTGPREQLGRFRFNFTPTLIGPVQPCTINLSGIGAQ